MLESILWVWVELHDLIANSCYMVPFKRLARAKSARSPPGRRRDAAAAGRSQVGVRNVA